MKATMRMYTLDAEGYLVMGPGHLARARRSVPHAVGALQFAVARMGTFAWRAQFTAWVTACDEARSQPRRRGVLPQIPLRMDVQPGAPQNAVLEAIRQLDLGLIGPGGALEVLDRPDVREAMRERI